MMISNLLAGGRREREGVSAEMCLSRATVRDCLGRVDFAGGGPPLPPPLPPACCTFWLRLMEWNYTRGGKGNSVGPESEQSQIHLYRVIGIPHLDWQQRYLLPIPLHSVVDPALPCTSPISFMPLDQFTFEFLQFCTIEKSECKERIRVYPAGAEYRPAGVVGLLQTPRPSPL